MAYTLQAIVIPSDARDRAADHGLTCVELAVPGLRLVPLPFDQVGDLGIPFLPLTDGGAATIGPDLDRLCRALSASTVVAYVEAEFFGGEGTQGCAPYENAKPSSEPMVGDEAINHALRRLGVRGDGERDEFDTAGLGMHRNTADWLKQK